MKEWVEELCPEIADWQAELIAEAAQKRAEAEREECAKICEEEGTLWGCHYAAKIRARGKE
jgi:hypothetical protein